MELLLERLQAELRTLTFQRETEFDSVDDPEFQKRLLVLIGTNTREISKLVVDLY